jgi:LmbE family N-acetylglucosaminyl deacetylase
MEYTPMKKISRRNLLETTLLTAGASLIGISASSGMNKSDDVKNKLLKIIVVGAHPDDPETTCGGTMALYSAAGHDVVSAYLTKGEAGITGKSYNEAAAIRTGEALKACSILNVRAEFLGQIDGNCEITQNRYTEMRDFLIKENPDLVFTHWPIDTHRDHRICSVLVYDAWLYLEKKFSFFYCEAMTGTQTQNFRPTHYIDITSVVKQKHEACFIHKSQLIEEEYPLYHARMEVFRGMESNCEYSEAFIEQATNPRINITGM